ncbi:MAG: universal stress protein [Gammaproteobacteria bacterium]|nr:universal stress protein [Gammaproteobacteria bacterium]
MNSYDEILVALELVGNEDYLIESALKVATDASMIKLVHVCEQIFYPSGPYVGGITMVAPQIDTVALQLRLTELADKYSLAKEGHIVCLGRAASEIHRVAEENAIHLIVIGSHGRHGIQLLLGSTANAVLHGAKCDVLAVRVRGQA